MWNRVRKPVLSCLILAYIWIVVCQLTPAFPFKKALYAPFRMSVDALGLWQNFGVFVPDPRKNNAFIDALVTFDDGSVAVWEYPRMETLNVVAKSQKERYRKYGYDHVYYDSERMLWPDLARYVARQYSASKHAPVEVVLRRHWVDITAPNDNQRQLQQTFGDEPFHTQKIHPEDLR
jgi:hypothetical protein